MISGNDKPRPFTRDELRRPFEGELATRFPPVLSPQQVAELLGLSKNTVYEWISRSRLDGSFRRRGKHVLFWRDRVLEIVFNGPAWVDQEFSDEN